MKCANTHYINEYHSDQERRSDELKRKIKEATGIVDSGAIKEDEMNAIEFDYLTHKSICKALKTKDLCEVGRLFREAAIEYVVTTL